LGLMATGRPSRFNVRAAGSNSYPPKRIKTCSVNDLPDIRRN
jgi:hypothetical protein